MCLVPHPSSTSKIANAEVSTFQKTKANSPGASLHEKCSFKQDKWMLRSKASLIIFKFNFSCRDISFEVCLFKEKNTHTYFLFVISLRRIYAKHWACVPCKGLLELSLWIPVTWSSMFYAEGYTWNEWKPVSARLLIALGVYIRIKIETKFKIRFKCAEVFVLWGLI